MESCDYLVIGAGIIGLSVARELKQREPTKQIIVVEKEADVAYHASGRNSGMLHAGFYYSKDSLKAKFTREGNEQLRAYAVSHGLAMNTSGKLVVACDEEELEGLQELKRRGDANGVELHWVEEADLAKYDPNAKSYKQALFSPNTACVDPIAVCKTIRQELEEQGVTFYFNTRFERTDEPGVAVCHNRRIQYQYFINAAGLYADKIAYQFGFGKKYTIVPFKGIYLKYARNHDLIEKHIYPVPNLANPFLGVHFTKTVDGSIKIGPTAIPAFWRENYQGFRHFKLGEFLSVIYYEAILFITNSFNFRKLAFEEIKKYNKAKFVDMARRLVHHLDLEGFGQYLRPGIRAQLMDKRTLQLVQDFVVEGDAHSFHVLNAVSPAFTCSFSFAKYIVDEVVKKTIA